MPTTFDIEKIIGKTGYVPLDQIYGVDIEAGTFDEHPDFGNFKTEYREDVLDMLLRAKTPDDLPAVILYPNDDDTLVVVDGHHRIANAVARCHAVHNAGKDYAASKWFRVKAEVKEASIDRDEIRFAQFRYNIEDGRDSLTDAEAMGAVEYFYRNGYKDAEQLCTLLQLDDERWLGRFVEIMKSGVPEVRDAVRSGSISAGTGAKIARKKDRSEQAAAVQSAAEAGAAPGSVEERKAAGVARERAKLLSVKDLDEIMFGGDFFQSVLAAISAKTFTPDDEPELYWKFKTFAIVWGIGALGTSEQVKRFRVRYDAFRTALEDAQAKARAKKDNKAADARRTRGVQTGKTDESDAPKRGRPKKTAAEPAPEVEPEADAPKRGRGRPKKNAAPIDDSAPAPEEAPKPRRRPSIAPPAEAEPPKQSALDKFADIDDSVDTHEADVPAADDDPDDEGLD